MAFLRTILLLLACLAPPALWASQDAAPRLMLATDYRGSGDVSTYWVSEKLDGVRGRWDGRQLWTRGGQRISAPAWFTANRPGSRRSGPPWPWMASSGWGAAASMKSADSCAPDNQPMPPGAGCASWCSTFPITAEYSKHG